MNVPEEHLKRLKEQHAIWLEHPVTQQLLKVLDEREAKMKNTLIDSVMIASDKEQEDKLRSAITTLHAMIVIVKDSTIFVNLITQQ